MQVGEQLPVLKLRSQRVRGVHGQAGLSHPALPAYHHHRHRESRAARRRGGQLLADLADLLGSAGEVGDIRRQQLRHRPRQRRNAHRSRGQVQRRVGGEDGVLQPLQLTARLDAQLVDHHPADLLVGLQCLGRPAGTVQCQHQLAMQPVPQRKLRHERDQLADELVMPAELQLQLQPVLDRRHPLLVQLGRRRAYQQAVDPVQRRTAPQPQRRTVIRHRYTCVRHNSGWLEGPMR